MNEFSLLNERNEAAENRGEENKAETERAFENPPAPREYQPINLVAQTPVPVTKTVVPPPVPVKTAEELPVSIQTEEHNFEHDLAVNDRRQRFGGEILRLALIGILAVGFLLLNFLFGASDKAPESFAVAKKTLANSDFRFYVFASFYLFAFSAGIALLQRYFAADAGVYDLKYLRLRDKASAAAPVAGENVSHLIPHSRRGFLDGFWLYLFGGETDEIHQQTENAKDARDFLFKLSGALLFLSGLLLWLGAMSLILAFGVVFKQFGA